MQMPAAAHSAYVSQADHAILICSGGCGSERSWSLFAFAALIFAAINFAPARSADFYRLVLGEFYERSQSRGCVRSVARFKF